MTNQPIRRPADIWPGFLLDEYRRLARLPKPPVCLEPDPDNDETCFRCTKTCDSPYFQYCQSGQDYAGLLATVAWLREGPKIADVTEEQWQALSRVEVRLPVSGFAMPYPSLLINMPPGKMHKYVILHRADLDWRVWGHAAPVPVLIGCSVSHDNNHDVVTVARECGGEDLEASLGTFSLGVSSDEADSALLSLRVACNMALAMTNYGCQAGYVFPEEVARERKFIAKGDRPSRDGRKASGRLAEQPVLLKLDRTVELFHRRGGHATAEQTGREMPFHWRRGHWRRLPNSKLVLVKPCMVRADLLLVSPDETTTTYT